MPGKDAPYPEAMRRHAELKPRFGYRRIRLRLMAEGLSLSEEKALRLRLLRLTAMAHERWAHTACRLFPG
jgi:hypothetical protein